MLQRSDLGTRTVAVYGIHIYNEEKAHAEHAEHLKEENGGEMPEKKVYPYMNVRSVISLSFLTNRSQSLVRPFIALMLNSFFGWVHRKKAFPWGPQTIFFNPEVNAPASDEV